MKTLHFDYAAALVPEEALHEMSLALLPEIERMQSVAAKAGYDDDRSSINLPLDTTQNAKLRSLHKEVDALVVIGIGGSNLGTVAIHEAVNGKLHNGFRGPRVFFADTVDADSMADICSMLEAYMTHKKTVVLNVISKSGTTTETVANFTVLLELLQKHDPRHARNIVVTTDEGSALWQLAQMQDYPTLPIPKRVGGRYSVLSAVGLYPLQLLGVDTHSLLAGAAAMRERCLKLSLKENPAAQLASLLHYHATHGKNIADMFLFSTELESLGKWYRQLLAESIGKEFNRDGTRRVHVGITPTVSIGSTDLHSVGQLYLGGPADKFTEFVTVEKVRHVTTPSYPEFDALVPHLQHTELAHIMQAIVQGTQTAYQHHARPFCHIQLADKSPYSLGQFMQLHMMAVMYLGYLLQVNPFDQPNVEAYKIETKKILEKKRN